MTPVSLPAAALAALAAVPILLVLALMVLRRWPGSRAGIAGWVASVGVAVFAFGTGADVLVVSQAKALTHSAFVLYIIWLAIAFYHVVHLSGALETIGAGLGRLTTNDVLQLLLIAWVFASFLQGVTGFGVPVAVVTPLLIGLGFPPIASVVAASVGHGWAVTFGSLASSFYAMIGVTGVPGEQLAPWSALLLGLAAFPAGLMACHAYRGWQSVRSGLGAVIVGAAVMGGTQYVLAVRGYWTLAAFVAGFVGLGVFAAMAAVAGHASRRDPEGGSQASTPGSSAIVGHPGLARTRAHALRPMGVAEAMVGYGILLVVAVAARLSGSIDSALGRVAIEPSFPATSTGLGWQNPAGPGASISVFGHAGALILYASVLTFIVFAARGRYPTHAARRVVRRTWRGARQPTLAILFLVGMGTLMSDSGMTYALALGISRATGPAFPLASPFIGALGAFVTGSNTNSNVLFANLQASTADLLGLDRLLILGAQNVGGAVGSVFAPAKIIVACSTAWALLTGEEGEVLRLTLRYGVTMIAVAGLLVLAVSMTG